MALPELECTGLLFGDACVIAIPAGPETSTTALLVEGEGFSARQITTESVPVPGAAYGPLALPEILTNLVAAKDTTALLVDDLPATTRELRLTLMRDGRAVARRNITPTRLPAIMSAPRGAVITALTPAGSAKRVTVLADGKPLNQIAATASCDTDPVPQQHEFALPESLFDGRKHLFTLQSVDDSDEIQTLTWTCAPEHVRNSHAESLNWRHLANSFPPHEIDRVAAFLVNPALPQADRPMPPRPHSDQPVRDALFVHHLTGAGAIATPTIADVSEAMAGHCRAFALLPSDEAVRYAAEAGCGSALTQQVPTLALSGLPELLDSLPRNGRAIFLPGGATLTAEGAALVQAADTQVHVSVPALSLTRTSWQLDVQPLVSSPDLFEACAIIPCSALGRTLEFGESRHDEAIIATCRVIGESSATIARIPSPPIAFDTRRGEYRLVIDAQRVEDIDAFESRLPALLSITPHCTVVGPRQLLLRLKENQLAPGITGVISLGDPVLIDNPAITAAMPPQPCFGFAADAIEPILSLSRADLELAIAFALHHTRQKSACRIFLAEKSADLGTAQIHFTCTMPL